MNLPTPPDRGYFNHCIVALYWGCPFQGAGVLLSPGKELTACSLDGLSEVRAPCTGSSHDQDQHILEPNYGNYRAGKA